MNILYIVQQSIYNNDGKWISADSNVNMMCGILRELVRKTDWNFYVVMGKLEDFADIKNYDELIKHKRIVMVPYDFPVDAFLNRQHFNVKDFGTMIKNLPKIDIVWNNITELTRNMKTYFYYKDLSPKIISSCYWLDTPHLAGENKVPKEISYQWRQFDGFECSDLISFTCDSVYEAFYENARYDFAISGISNIREKEVIWDFGYSQIEMNKYKTVETSPKKILFLNRLSGINYTKHEEFISAVNKLYEIRQDFEVIFTNPSQKISWDYLKSKVKSLNIIKKTVLSREEYAKLLWESHISIHLYDKERMGGCAHRESLHCKNIVITPKLFEYARIQGDKYPFYANKNLTNLVEVLNRALDSKFEDIFDVHNILERNKESSFEVVSGKVIKDIKKIC